MLQSPFVRVAAVVATAEILLISLILPSEVWSHAETILAMCGYVGAWLAAMTVGAQTFAGPAGRASSIVHWPIIGVTWVWALGSGAVVAVALGLSIKWILGIHGLAALVSVGVVLITRNVGKHIDHVDAEVARGATTQAELQSAIASARRLLARSDLDSAVAQRIRILLDKSSVLPRGVLAGVSASSILCAIRALADASDTVEVIAAVERLEIAVVCAVP